MLRGEAPDALRSSNEGPRTLPVIICLFKVYILMHLAVGKSQSASLRKEDLSRELKDGEEQTKPVVPNFLGTRDQFHGRQFSMDGSAGGWGGWFQDD